MIYCQQNALIPKISVAPIETLIYNINDRLYVYVGTGVLDGPVILQRKITSPQAID